MIKSTNVAQKQKKFLSFRWRVLWLILTPLLLAIFSTQVILWIALNGSHQRQRDNFVQESLEKINNYLEEHQQGFESMIAINQTALARQDIDYNNLSSLEQYFWYQMQYNTLLYQVYYANEKGDWLSIKRANDGQLISLYKSEETKGELWQYSLDPKGNRQAKTTVTKQLFNPQIKPWYVDAKTQKKVGWTNTYLFAGAGENLGDKNLGITLYQPLLNNSNKNFEGVIGIDLKFDHLNQYLRDIDRTQGNAKLFIMDCSAEMDSSRSSRLVAQSNLDQTNQGLFNAIEENAQNYCPNKQGLARIQGYDVEIVPLNQTIRNLNWLGVIAIPENYFVKNSAWILQFILLGGVVLIIIASGIAFVVSRNLSEPITTITDAAQAIQDKNYKDVDITKLQKVAKRNHELGILAKVFLKMITTIYDREESLRKKLLYMEETYINVPSQSSEDEYLDQLIKKSRDLCSSKKNN
ncbi:MAG: hypothetical protein AB4058_00170 [Microcystaceae cyanobacterium]